MSRPPIRRLATAAVAAALIPAGFAASSSTTARADESSPAVRTDERGPGQEHRGRGGHGGRTFERLATFPVYRNSADPRQETVAEITAVSTDGRLLISTDSPGGRVTFTDIRDPRRPRPAGALAVGGEPTSVAVYRAFALIAVNTSPSFTAPSGELLVVALDDRRIVARIDLGGQPDSVAVSPAGARGGAFAAIAIENERDEDVADGAVPQLPGGNVVVVPLTGSPTRWRGSTIDLRPALTGRPGVVAPEDPEPEYVTINGRNQAAVTVQENNAIAIIDLPTRRVVRAFSAGAVDLAGVDTVEDDTIDPTGSLTGVPREPDGVAWIGTGLIATANEGDLAGGSRGWTIFDAVTGRPVWDAGNSLERAAIAVGLYPESRSENKGTEPENIAVAVIDGRRYAFVGAERGNFVAVYDLADPRAPQLRQILPVSNGPEGLLPVPGRNLFVASSEVDVPEDDARSTITIFRTSRKAPFFPSIRSVAAAGAPIGWGALSGLTADPRQRDRLWSVSDSYYSPTTIYGIRLADRRRQGPAAITTAITVTENGTPIGVDAEGIAARPSGGFWLAAEGATGSDNELLQVAADGAVQRRVPLPAGISSALGSRGLEGVAVTGTGAGEQLVVALQSPLTTDPAGVVRVGRYAVATGAWTWFGYPLAAGSTVGLSEITALGGNRFAVIERDNVAGPTAAVKRIYTVKLPTADPAPGAPAALPLLTKRLARDLLPDLNATRGWTQEKVEGLTVGGDGHVYVVTDNDGVEDATGETVFLDLGAATKVFGPRR